MLLLVGGGAAPVEGDEPATADLAKRASAGLAAGLRWLQTTQAEDGVYALVPPKGMNPELLGGYPGGPWHKGAHALCLYALLACRDAPPDAGIRKGIARLRQFWEDRHIAASRTGPGDDGTTTYFVALSLLALDAWRGPVRAHLNTFPETRGARAGPLTPRDQQWARELVAWLVAAQQPGKGNAAPPVPAKGGTPSTRKAKQPRIPSTISRPRLADGGGFGYSAPAMSWSHQDLSNSQFAVLGLKAGARLGVAVPPAVWNRALRYFLVAQEKKGPAHPGVAATGFELPEAAEPPPSGARRPSAPAVTCRGWGYNASGRLRSDGETGIDEMMRRQAEADIAMTAGGVVSVAICRSELLGDRSLTKLLQKSAARSLRDGVASMARFLDARSADSKGAGAHHDPFSSYYCLYGIERACLLAGIELLGSHDWYDLGARRILSSQRDDGAFVSEPVTAGSGFRLIDTSFAVLFLRRALYRKLAPVTTPAAKAQK